MTKYVLKSGKFVDNSGKLLEIGATVDLNPTQAEAFKDRFELASKAEQKAADEKTGETGDENSGDADAKPKADGEPKPKPTPNPTPATTNKTAGK